MKDVSASPHGEGPVGTPGQPGGIEEGQHGLTTAPHLPCCACTDKGWLGLGVRIEGLRKGVWVTALAAGAPGEGIPGRGGGGSPAAPVCAWGRDW